VNVSSYAEYRGSRGVEADARTETEAACECEYDCEWESDMDCEWACECECEYGAVIAVPWIEDSVWVELLGRYVASGGPAMGRLPARGGDSDLSGGSTGRTYCCFWG
jgi:hypothetical protein